jgi:hypothetical protein
VALAEDKIAEANTLITESIALRQELGETISLAQSKLVLAEIQWEQGRYEAAGKTAREAAASFHAVLASGWEAEASLVLGRSALALGDARQARASLDTASRLLNDSKDLPRLIRRDLLQARLQFAAGQQAESAAILERLSEQAGRAGLRRAQMEIRLALVQTGRATAASLVADARKAGFHLIERKAGESVPASPPHSGGDLR